MQKTGGKQRPPLRKVIKSQMRRAEVEERKRDLTAAQPDNNNGIGNLSPSSNYLTCKWIKFFNQKSEWKTHSDRVEVRNKTQLSAV